MIRPRWLSRLWADFFGYFWLPCPVCREMFGGHEASGWAYRNRVTCRRKGCVGYAQRWGRT